MKSTQRAIKVQGHGKTNHSKALKVYRFNSVVLLYLFRVTPCRFVSCCVVLRATTSAGQMASSDVDSAMLKDFLGFLNEAWTAYHATAEARRRLLEAGFVELDEAEPAHDVKVFCFLGLRRR